MFCCRYVQSGHVKTVKSYQPAAANGVAILKAEVVPSMRLNSKSHEPWVVAALDGVVQCAHCTCMAGLGEVCSHVGAILFKVEMGVRLGLTKKSCTSEACKWNATFREHVDPTPITEAGSACNTNLPPGVANIQADGKAELPCKDVLTSLRAICPRAVFFKMIPKVDEEETDTASECEDEVPEGLKPGCPPLMTSLADYPDELGDEEALAKFKSVCTPETLARLEEVTRRQSASLAWKAHRLGRITGTTSHQILTSKADVPSEKLVSRLLEPGANLDHVDAFQYGKVMESRVRKLFVAVMSQRHVRFACSESGFIVDREDVFLGASADGIVSCECCGKGTIEIKCSHKHKDVSVSHAASSDPSFCMDATLKLKQSHQYYTQQFEMMTDDVTFCDFIVFAKDMVIDRVYKDDTFCSYLRGKCVTFYRLRVLSRLRRGQPENPKQEARSVCWCRRPPHMSATIRCGDRDCPIRVYHMKCVWLKRKTSTWVCLECKNE